MSDCEKLDVKLTRGLSYDFQEAVNDVTVWREQLPFGFISDYLSKVIRSWTPTVAVAIFSDTGTGKNYFVENVLVPDAGLYKQEVLLITNRVALGRQVKYRLAEMFGEAWKLRDYSDQGLDKVTDFGNLTVISYQQLETWMNENSNNLKKLKRDFRYVVMDEIHYCLSDCSFNAMTDLTLDYITSAFCDSVRIYMTATPEQIFPVLASKESGMGSVYDSAGWLQGLYKWHIYQFAHNFEQITPFAFQDTDDIVAFLRKTDVKEKSVVFVDSKESGMSLIQKCGFGAMITAESKSPQDSSNEIYNNIVRNEKFEGRLLVCTSVLENGVNLKDSQIKNVVIYTSDKIRMLQMLGRIRRESDQIINLFIKNEELCDASYRIEALQAQSTALRMYYANPTAFCSQFITDSSPRAKVRGSFTVMQDGSSHINSLRLTQIEYYELPFWVHIKEQMEQRDKYALIRAKFGWIEKEFTQESILRGNGYHRELAQLILYLKSKEGQEILKNEQEEFKRCFSEKYRAVFGKREEDKVTDQIYGLSIIKDCLLKSELPFEIINERNYWMIKRINFTENQEG